MVFLGGDFVGRQAERRWLSDRLSEPSSGAAVLVVGEAGVGKSRLLATAVEAAESTGRRVLRGRALPGRQMPFRIFNEVFAGAARRFGIPEHPALTTFRGPLARLVPDWKGPDGGVADVLLVGEGALRLLKLLGDPGGVVVAVEDVHWADPDSLAVLEYLCEHGPGEGLVIAATVRDEPGPALDRLRALVGRKTSWLRLNPLSPSEIAELCRSCAGDELPDDAVRFVIDHSDGLPFAVEELVAGLLASGTLVRGPDGWHLAGRLEPSVPSTVTLSVSERLQGLPTERLEVIEMAAVLGRTFDWRLVAACTGQSEEAVMSALQDGRGLGIITGGTAGSDHRFRHALTREAVLGLMEASDRSRLARSALEQLEPPPDDEACALAAGLAVTAGDTGRSAELRADLAERLVSSGAVAAATEALREALAAAPDHRNAAAWRMRLLRLLIVSGRLGEADEEASAMRADGQAATAALALAEAEALRHNWDRVEQLLHEAGAVGSPNGSDRIRRLLVEAELAAGRFRGDEASRLVADAMTLAENGSDLRLQAETLISAARLLQPWTLERARSQLGEAASLTFSAGHRRETALALGALADLDVLAVVKPDHCEQALTAAYDAGALGLVASATHDLAMVSALRYELAEATRWADECVALARRYHLGWLEAAGLTKQAFVQALTGRTDEAESRLAAAEAIAGGDPRGLSLMDGNVRAAAYLNQEDLSLASAALARACDLAERHHLEPRPYLGLAVLVSAASGEDPEPLAQRLEENGLSWPPVVAGLVAAARAMAAGRADAPERAGQLCALSWDLLRSTPWHDAIARRYVGESQLVDGWGDPGATLPPAEEFFRQASLAVSEEACKRLLLASRARRGAGRDAVPPSVARFGITPREFEVLALVAEGLTNRQIADRLYLSVRTVDKHVERLMTKTGRPNRTALASLASSRRAT